MLAICTCETELRDDGCPFAAGTDVAMDADDPIWAATRAMAHAAIATKVLWGVRRVADRLDSVDIRATPYGQADKRRVAATRALECAATADACDGKEWSSGDRSDVFNALGVAARQANHV
ncbi:hypothetical protein WL24_22255 [Burkholderia ubonensis]|nr:hypothetical protein WL24_22255 [Burkholderia ubonensis]